MSITVGDIIKVVSTLVWTDGNIMQNVFAAVITGSGGPFTEADIVDDALEWVEDMFFELTGSMSDDCDGSQVQVYVYDSVDDDFDELGTIGWVFDPSSAGDQLPRGSAGLVIGYTTDPDVQGKKYLGGIVESLFTGGLYVAGLLVDMLDFAAIWVTPFVGGTSTASWTPGVWSPKETNLFPFGTSISASAIPAYQRRRKRGVGA